MPRYAMSLLLLAALLLGLGPAAVHGRDATPAAVATGPRTLLDVTVDRAELPGEEGFIIFGRQTLQPGTKRTNTPPSPTGAELIVVESGALTFQIPGADGRILRGTSTGSPSEEPAPADTPTTLEAGDALVFPMQTHVWMNEGDVPTVMLFAAVIEPLGPPPPDPTDVGEETTEFLGQTAGAWPELPPGPVNFSLRTDSVDAGELLPAPAGGVQAIAQMSGDPSALLIADNGVLNIGKEPADLFLVALTPVAAMAATPAATPMLSTTSPNAPAEVLLTATFPAARLPQGPAAVEFWRSSWEPGFEYLATEYHPSVSVGGDLVLSGAWGARSDGDILLWRNGRTEDAPLNQEVVLSPGEAVVYLDNAANEWIRNAADTPTETANFAITLGEDYQGPNLGVDWEASGLSGHDVTVTIDRQTLAPGEALSVTPPATTSP